MSTIVRWISLKRGNDLSGSGKSAAKCKGYSATMKRGERGQPIDIRIN